MFHLVCNGKSCLLTQRAFPKSLPASSHLHCAGPQSAAMRRNLNLFTQLKSLTWKDWPWLPPSAISREGEELIRPSGGTPCRSPQTQDPLKMCFILNHSINYGVTFSSGFPSLEMKLFTYCKTSSWCFGKSLDKNQLYTKSEQFFYTIPEKMNLASYEKSSDHSEKEVNLKWTNPSS